MNYGALKEQIDNGEWRNAKTELGKIVSTGEWNDELAIYAAAIAFAEEKEQDACEYIRQGLICNYRNYELYFMLGNYYEKINQEQAWLCYEQAEYYCSDVNDSELIEKCKKRLEQKKAYLVRKVSVIISTHNAAALTRQCIESIRNTTAKACYELIVIDNASTDQTAEWLKEQSDIKTLTYDTKAGIPEMLNWGIKEAECENDILILDSDTFMLPNALFWLRMGLYSEKKVGAAGCLTNKDINGQQVLEQFSDVNEYIAYGARVNVPMHEPYERKVWLAGFGMLIKREALNEIGGFDEILSPGRNADTDLCVRMNYAGWKVLLCHNSFILYYQHGENSRIRYAKKYEDSKFYEKWKFDLEYYALPKESMIQMITHPLEEKITVLEVGCGCGTTLARIKYLWKRAEIFGIELNEKVAELGSNVGNVVTGNIESFAFPYEKKSFDYIILADVLEHLHEPAETLKQLMEYLKDDGRILCSIPNIMNQNVIAGLLMGRFQYEKDGILDRTHLRFFTLDSIKEMVDLCGMKIEALNATFNPVTDNPREQELLEALYKIPHIADKELFAVYQYVFSAKKRGL